MSDAATLTIVTLNTWKCGGAYWRRLPLMARAVAEAAPDVVFLQEVLRAPGADDADTSAVIAEATGLIAHDEKARKTPRDVVGQQVESWSGLTILSRWPLATERLDLPVTEGRDWDRIALIGSGTTPFGPLTFVNLHLTHPPEEGAMRARQMWTILDHLGRRDNGGAVAPVILGGDFNDEPGSPALKAVEGDDRWIAASAMASRGEGAFVTYPDTGQCVDHVYLLEAPPTPAWTIVSCEPVGDWAEDGITPSDHVGLRTVLAPATDSAG